jgi:hypothetical protein
MKRCLNYERKNMNTKMVLFGAVVTAFTFSSFATEPLLSPRAAGNQINRVASPVDSSATTDTYVDANTPLFSPRAAGNQIRILQDTSTDVNPVQDYERSITASPRAITEYISHPGTSYDQTVMVGALK